MSQLDFTAVADGRELVGMVYEQEVFDDVVIAEHRDGFSVLLRDVIFKRCRTDPGTCSISGSVELDGVQFIDFRCGDTLRIDTNCKMSRVLVKGRSPARLVVRARSAERHGSCSSEMSKEDWSLDIREFAREVDVIGLGADNVRRDTERHVAISLPESGIVDWADLGVNTLSYWKFAADRIVDAGARSGVLSFPNAKRKSFERNMHELVLLREHGICA
jgi:hypothetical protein